MQQIVNPASVMTGGGKKYAHYITVRSTETVNPWYAWAFYCGPIITDTNEAFTVESLQTWLLGLGANPAISPSIEGIPASGYHEDDQVCGVCNTGVSLSVVVRDGNQMKRKQLPTSNLGVFVDRIKEI